MSESWGSKFWLAHKYSHSVLYPSPTKERWSRPLRLLSLNQLVNCGCQTFQALVNLEAGRPVGCDISSPSLAIAMGNLPTPMVIQPHPWVIKYDQFWWLSTNLMTNIVHITLWQINLEAIINGRFSDLSESNQKPTAQIYGTNRVSFANSSSL